MESVALNLYSIIKIIFALSLSRMSISSQMEQRCVYVVTTDKLFMSSHNMAYMISVAYILFATSHLWIDLSRTPAHSTNVCRKQITHAHQQQEHQQRIGMRQTSTHPIFASAVESLQTLEQTNDVKFVQRVEKLHLSLSRIPNRLNV